MVKRSRPSDAGGVLDVPSGNLGASITDSYREPATQKDLSQRLSAGVGKIAVHHRRHEYVPSGVVALATTSKGGKFVAAARESGAIEIYEINPAATNFSMIKVIPGSQNSSISCMLWIEHTARSLRLLTGGYDGVILDWDLDSICVKASYTSSGGAVWAMASKKLFKGSLQLVATACDDGSIKFYRVESEGDIALKGSLASDSGRTLSVSWEKEGKRLVSGHSDGSLRVWHLEISDDRVTGSEAIKIALPSVPRTKTGRAGKTASKMSEEGSKGGENRICKVWSVLFLPGGVVASGDSAGRVCFWQSEYGSLLFDFHKHKTDVTTMVATHNGTGVFASGLDVRIAVFQKMTTKDGQDRWVYSHAKRPHTHDVRSLAVYHSGYQEYLISGSQDTRILWMAARGGNVAQRFLEAPLLDISMASEPPNFQVVTSPETGGRFMIASHHRTVDFWLLWGDPVDSWQDKEEGELLAMYDETCHIARMEIGDESHLISCQMSSCGKYLATSTCKRIKLMRIEGLSKLGGINEDGANVWGSSRERISIHPLKSRRLKPATKLVFTPDSQFLCAGHVDNSISLVELDGLRVKASLAFDPPSTISGSPPSRAILEHIRCMSVSSNGQFLACSILNRIQVMKLDTFEAVASFGIGTTVAALVFDPLEKLLVAVGMDKQLTVFEIQKQGLAEWSMKHPQLLKMNAMVGKIQGVQFCPGQVNSIIIWSEASICHIDFSAPMPSFDFQNFKRARTRCNDLPGTNARVVSLQSPHIILHMAFLGEKSALLVRCNRNKIEEGLPPPVYRVRFGRS